MGTPAIRSSSTPNTTRTQTAPARPSVMPQEEKKAGWAPKPQPGARTAADSFAAAPAPRPSVPTGVREALTTSWRDWSVSTTERATVHRSLEALSMPEYQAALKELDTAGLLESYTKGMDVQQRSAFLDQARRKGAIGALGDEKQKGPFDPPAIPGLYVQSPALPPALQQAVHQGNLELATGYENAYRGYIDRYAQGVMTQEDGASIRKLGPPAQFTHLSEPGLEPSHPQYRDYLGDWASKARWAPSEKPGWDAISNRMDDLTGEVRAGSYWLQLEAELVRKDGAVTRGTGIDVSVRDYGQLELAGKKSLGIEADAGAAKGAVKAEVKGGVKLQRGVHPHLHKEAEVKGSGQAGKHAGIGVEVSSTGTTELSLNLDEHVGSYAKGNLKEATLEGGVRLKAELSKNYELEGKIGLGMKGITAEQVEDALDPNSVGFFGEPPERAKQVPWSQLSEKAQRTYRARGWSEENW